MSNLLANAFTPVTATCQHIKPPWNSCAVNVRFNNLPYISVSINLLDLEKTYKCLTDAKVTDVLRCTVAYDHLRFDLSTEFFRITAKVRSSCAATLSQLGSFGIPVRVLHIAALARQSAETRSVRSAAKSVSSAKTMKLLFGRDGQTGVVEIESLSSSFLSGPVTPVAPPNLPGSSPPRRFDPSRLRECLRAVEPCACSDEFYPQLCQISIEDGVALAFDSSQYGRVEDAQVRGLSFRIDRWLVRSLDKLLARLDRETSVIDLADGRVYIADETLDISFDEPRLIMPKYAPDITSASTDVINFSCEHLPLIVGLERAGLIAPRGRPSDDLLFELDLVYDGGDFQIEIYAEHVRNRALCNLDVTISGCVEDIAARVLRDGSSTLRYDGEAAGGHIAAEVSLGDAPRRLALGNYSHRAFKTVLSALPDSALEFVCQPNKFVKIEAISGHFDALYIFAHQSRYVQAGIRPQRRRSKRQSRRRA